MGDELVNLRYGIAVHFRDHLTDRVDLASQDAASAVTRRTEQCLCDEESHDRQCEQRTCRPVVGNNLKLIAQISGLLSQASSLPTQLERRAVNLGVNNKRNLVPSLCVVVTRPVSLVRALKMSLFLL